MAVKRKVEKKQQVAGKAAKNQVKKKVKAAKAAKKAARNQNRVKAVKEKNLLSTFNVRLKNISNLNKILF